MPNFDLENKHQGIVVGVDEVGRGPWAGPVVAVTCYIDQSHFLGEILHLISDSKKLTSKKRQHILENIRPLEGKSFQYGLGIASVEEIDDLNIAQATYLAMQRSLENVQMSVDYALVDGIGKPNLSVPYETVIKGDDKSYSIALASIIAKEYRDQLMANLSKEYPFYAWERNAGYGTKDHQNGLKEQGVTPHHRKSFKPIQVYLDQKVA